MLDPDPSEGKQGLQLESVAWLLFAAKAKEQEMSRGEKGRILQYSDRTESFSNDLAVLLRVTALQDRASQQDT